MSADIVELREPCMLGLELSHRIYRLLMDIPTRNSHIDDDGKCGNWEGASPEGYVYAAGSEQEMQEANDLLERAARLIEGVCAREWMRCENNTLGLTFEAYLQSRQGLPPA